MFRVRPSETRQHQPTICSRPGRRPSTRVSGPTGRRSSTSSRQTMTHTGTTVPSRGQSPKGPVSRGEETTPEVD